MNETVEIILLNIAFWSSIKAIATFIEIKTWDYIVAMTEGENA